MDLYKIIMWVVVAAIIGFVVYYVYTHFIAKKEE